MQMHVNSHRDAGYPRNEGLIYISKMSVFLVWRNGAAYMLHIRKYPSLNSND